MKKQTVTLISASAGSGKTYRLMQIVADEVSHGLKASGLIAVTYTKKAAEELKTRIGEKLVEEGHLEASRSMSTSRIGTVHSVCAELLKRFAFETGESPRQTIIDEVAAGILFESALNESLTPDQLKVLSSLSTKLSISSGELIDRVRAMAELVRQNNMDDLALQESLKLSLAQINDVLEPASKAKNLDQLAIELKNFAKAFPESPDAQANTGKAHAFTLEMKRKLVDQKSTLTWSDWVKLSKLAPGVKSAAHFEGVIESAKTFLSEPTLREDLALCTATIFEITKQVNEAYNVRKSKLAVVDYADLEQKTLLLLDLKVVREQLASELEVLLVDEFQDTNPVQLAIFLKLSSLCRNTYWVGDLKQSIYKFRGADPALMTSILAELNSGDPVILGDNWRSRPEIVNFANDLFTSAFKTDDIPAKQIVQNPKWKHSLNGDGLVVWESAGKNQGEHAAKLAGGIRDLLSSQRQIVDRETEASRPIRSSDIAILLRSNLECSALSGQLAELGVQSAVSAGLLIAQPEVSLAIAALRFLISSSDTIAAAELALGLGADHNKWFSDALALEQQRRLESGGALNVEGWHPVLAALSSGRSEVSDMSVSEKLDFAIALSSLETRFERSEGGQMRLANLSALRQEARAYEASCQSQLIACTDSGFLNYLDSEEALTPSSAHKDAVNITTYHSSKGLEWPVVIMGSLGKTPHEPSLFEIRVENKDGTSFNVKDPLANRLIAYLEWPFGDQKKVPELEERTKNLPKLEELKQKSDAELRRLLYVGVTRARECLILINDFGKKTVAASSLGVLGEGFEFPKPGQPMLIGKKKHECAHLELEAPAAPLAKSRKKSAVAKTLALPIGEPLKESIRLYMQPSGLTPELTPFLETNVEMGAAVIFGKSLLFNRSAEPTSNIGVPGADVVGTAVHLFLGSDVATDSRDLRLKHADRIVSDWNISQLINAESLVASSDRFRNEVLKRWPKAVIQSEVPVEFELDGSVVRGTMDCIADDGETLIIFDHKTIEKETPVEKVAHKYRLQLAAYAEAARRAYPTRKVQLWLHNPNGWMQEVVLRESIGAQTKSMKQA